MPGMATPSIVFCLLCINPGLIARPDARSFGGGLAAVPGVGAMPGMATPSIVLCALGGDACRGATWVSLHNGGGVGWGEVINGGFGMVIDGSADADRRIESMIAWDVNNGIARRAWARNEGAEFAIRRAMAADERMRVTLPERADDAIVNDALRGS